jgi:spoIIIJ-associated protein
MTEHDVSDRTIGVPEETTVSAEGAEVTEVDVEAPEDAVDTDEVATATEAVDDETEDDVVDSEDDAVDSEDEGSESQDAGGVRGGRRARLEQEGDIAADYLEELLEIADLDGDLDMDVEGDRATVSIVGANLPQLIGPQGEVLEALQELTRLAVYRETGERSRLMLDVSGHRAERRTALEKEAARVVAQVKESGERAQFDPMSPFERKVVHDVVAAAGLSSESEGTEPRRYVVVLPA